MTKMEPFDEIELDVVIIQGTSLQVGVASVERIVLRLDGHGPTGFYDVIYVYTDDGIELVTPAFNCDSWATRLKNAKSTT